MIGVLHDINQALRLSEKVLVMKNGHVQAYGAAEEILSASLLERIYDIDVVQYMKESLRVWESA